MIWAKYTQVTSLRSRNSNLSRIKFRKRNAKLWSPLRRIKKKRTSQARRTTAEPRLNQQLVSREIFKSSSAERLTKRRTIKVLTLQELKSQREEMIRSTIWWLRSPESLNFANRFANDRMTLKLSRLETPKWLISSKSCLSYEKKSTG